jgi:DNA uptake protein ComE-like DNA-binding protein
VKLPAIQRPNEERGSIMVLVLWISVGLLTLAIYFADSMRFEMRAADNRVATVAADHAIDGAARYLTYILSNLETNGALPDLTLYLNQQVPVGEATFWIIGRLVDSQQQQQQQQVRQMGGTISLNGALTTPVFGLVDEASKINLNTCTVEMLEALPGMTAELAAAIVDWRDADSEITENGAEDDYYQRLTPPRRCKNSRFESVDELRLVAGATLDLLYGEDWNRNGVLDPNENDGSETWPLDDSDGVLDAGLLEYVTVYSREMNLRSDGTARVNVNTGGQQLRRLFEEKFGQQRAQEIQQALGNNPNVRSLLEFYSRSRMTADEFAQIHTDVTVTNATVIEGLINVNTASEAVLAALPGVGANLAPTLIAYRQQNPDRLNTIAWLTEVLDENAQRQVGPYVTVASYQFSADIAAVGRIDRGYRRVRFVFDTTEDRPKIVLRQDLTHLGWALSLPVRENLQLSWNLGQ